MANILETIFTITAGKGKTYFTSSGAVSLDRTYVVASTGVGLYLGNSGTATMNNAGKKILYPKTGISPFKADILVQAGGNSSGKNLKISFDNTVVVNQDISTTDILKTETHEHFNLTTTAIINSTQNSSIVFTLTATSNGLFQSFGIDDTYIKLYFQQWDLTAQTVGDGWGTILTPGRVYNGESINYTCIVSNGCTFHGWYSDAAHTNLVSSDTTYTITASQDLVLYAYITRDVLALNNVYTKTNFHLGENAPGWFKPYKIWYKTLNGWEAQSNTNNLIAGNTYRYSDNFIQTFDLANIDSSLVNVSDSSLYSKNFTIFYYPWGHGIIYVKNNNNYIIQNITINSPGYFIQPMQDNSFIIHHNGEYSDTIQSIDITYQETISDEIKVFTFRIQFTTFERDIQFKDLNGNLYKEKLICTSPFTVTTPSGSEYSGFTGWREVYCGTPTGRILQLNESYWDVGWNNEIYYEPVFNE